jgi:hypothetical protein
MGTRNLIAVHVEGQYKIAQYGQWDGYPSGEGLATLGFSRTIVDQAARQAFADKCRAAKFLTQEDIDRINAELKSGAASMDAGGKYQQFSRDRGAEILRIVSQHEPGILLKNSLSFAGDSLFCEWAYVIDLDKGTLEAFKGFNQTELAEGERFAAPGLELEKTNGYHPVRHLKTYQLDALPDDDQFIKDLEPPEYD